MDHLDSGASLELGASHEMGSQFTVVELVNPESSSLDVLGLSRSFCINRILTHVYLDRDHRCEGSYMYLTLMLKLTYKEIGESTAYVL